MSSSPNTSSLSDIGISQKVGGEGSFCQAQLHTFINYLLGMLKQKDALSPGAPSQLRHIVRPHIFLFLFYLFDFCFYEKRSHIS